MQMAADVPEDAPKLGISSVIPMKIQKVEMGRVTFSARADKRHTNPMGGVHGGFAATVLDSVTGCAVHTMLDAGVGYGTIDLNVKMLRPIPMDKTLIAEGKVLNMSKRLGVSEGVIKDEAGKIYALATATCMILK